MSYLPPAAAKAVIVVDDAGCRRGRESGRHVRGERWTGGVMEGGKAARAVVLCGSGLNNCTAWHRARFKGAWRRVFAPLAVEKPWLHRHTQKVHDCYGGLPPAATPHAAAHHLPCLGVRLQAQEPDARVMAMHHVRQPHVRRSALSSCWAGCGAMLAPVHPPVAVAVVVYTNDVNVLFACHFQIESDACMLCSGSCSLRHSLQLNMWVRRHSRASAFPGTENTGHCLLKIMQNPSCAC